MVPQDPNDGVVESIAVHLDRDVRAPLALFDEAREGRIDFDRVQIGVELLPSGFDERNLAGHALSRTESPGKPLGLDFPPFGVRETLKQAVGDILQGNGSIEIADNVYHPESR